MQRIFSRFRQIIILFVILFFSLILMQSQAETGKGVQNLAGATFEVTAWMGSCLASVSSGLMQFYRQYVHLIDVGEENRVLKKREAYLENRLNALREIEIENQRLRELLAFQESVPYDMAPVGVVGKDFNSWSRTLIINQGSRSGIERGMAVVRPEGVVGRVLSVSPSYAQVLLVIDSNSDVPSIFQRTRAEGIVEGKITSQCQVKYLNRLADVQREDLVITSGLGGIYPKGLIVGTVHSVEKKPYGLFQEVTITPAVDFSRMEEVFVIKRRGLAGEDQRLRKPDA